MIIYHRFEYAGHSRNGFGKHSIDQFPSLTLSTVSGLQAQMNKLEATQHHVEASGKSELFSRVEIWEVLWNLSYEQGQVLTSLIGMSTVLRSKRQQLLFA